MVAISSSGLRRALVDALDQVDAATRDAFLTLADDDSPGRITEVADRHEITSVALRQRLHRARRLLQPQLASWMVAA